MICIFCRDAIMDEDVIYTSSCGCKYHKECVIYIISKKQNSCSICADSSIVSKLSELFDFSLLDPYKYVDKKHMDEIYDNYYSY